MKCETPGCNREQFCRGKCGLCHKREYEGVERPNILRSDNLKRCNMLDGDVRGLGRLLDALRKEWR